MKSKKEGRTHLILIERGEILVESLLAYCSTHHITCASFMGIGAVDSAELWHYVVEEGKYSSRIFTEPMEITNLTGNISLLDSKPHAHCHITLGRRDFSAVGGHLKDARVHAVCEITLTELPLNVSRHKDDAIGLNVWRMQ